MLDNCSQECFIQACLVKKLRMRVQRNSINFKVLTGEESHPTVAIKGLKVCSRLGSNKERINIPNFFTKDLPVDSSGIIPDLIMVTCGCKKTWCQLFTNENG